MCNIAKRPPMNNNEVTCTIGLLTENGCSTLIYLFNIFQDTLKGNAINDVTNCLIGISKHHITLPVDVTELNKIKKKHNSMKLLVFQTPLEQLTAQTFD